MSLSTACFHAREGPSSHGCCGVLYPTDYSGYMGWFPYKRITLKTKTKGGGAHIEWWFPPPARTFARTAPRTLEDRLYTVSDGSPGWLPNDIHPSERRPSWTAPEWSLERSLGQCFGRPSVGARTPRPPSIPHSIGVPLHRNPDRVIRAILRTSSIITILLGLAKG